MWVIPYTVEAAIGGEIVDIERPTATPITPQTPVLTTQPSTQPTGVKVSKFVTPMFKNSLFRGQALNPKIDSAGNLILKPTYEQLSKDYGISFADNYDLAYRYGKRNSKTPFVIEINKDYLDTLFPLDLDAGIGAYGKRTIGDENEQRVITKDNLVIPNGKYVIYNEADYSTIDTKSLIKKFIYYSGVENSRDELVFSAIEGLDYENVDLIRDELTKRFGSYDGVLYFIAKENHQSKIKYEGDPDAAIYSDNIATTIVQEAEDKYIIRGILQPAPKDYSEPTGLDESTDDWQNIDNDSENPLEC
jgi:hypothetical protein